MSAEGGERSGAGGLPPILEYDPSPTAVIEPAEHHKKIDVPEHCVVCFFQDVIGRLESEGKLRHVRSIRTEIGKHPIWTLEVSGRPVALLHPGVGAPLAVALVEAVIAFGCTKFVVCGGAGVLDRELAVGHPVVVTSAVRDEGTSYHYLPPSREVEPSPEATAALERALAARGIEYVRGKSWTTDAIFRETRDKVRRRRDEGCIVVEMEAASLFALARFRGVVLGQTVYSGDDVSGEAYDHRRWHKQTDSRERLFWVAAEACVSL